MNRVRHLGTYAQSLTLLPTTRVTRLSNGLTIATESHKAALTCSFGVFVDAGSSLESVNSNGVAHFCEHLLFKGTSSCSQVDIEKLVENKGAHLNAYTSREITAYYANSLSKDLDSFVPLLADILLNSNLSKDSIEKERDVILRESIEVDKNKEEVVFDHLHAIAFQGSGLGMTILGPNKNIKSLTQADMKAYLQENYTPDRMVLSAAGGVDHDAFVKLAEMYFGSMKPGKGKKVVEKARFYGSDLRARYDSHPTAHVAIAVEGVSWTNPDYFPLLVAQSIIGSWDRTHGAASHASSNLAQKLKHQPINSLGFLANSFSSFNTSYNDTGLFGVYFETENFEKIDDTIHHIQREWHRLALNVTDIEVFRAKNHLKTALLFQLDNTSSICEDIGRQMLTYGKRLTPFEIDGLVESVTAADVMKVAGQYLYDREVSVVGYGPVEGLPDYNRIRAAMSPSYF